MIFYFTGTGNSFAAAHTIAEITHDELVDIGESYRMGRFSFRVEQGETLGFVFPVYDRAVPRIVVDFIDWLAFITPNGNPFVPGYCFCAITCGEAVGNAAKELARTLKAALNIRLDASYSIEDVDNCIIKRSPGSPEARRMKNHAAHRQARSVGFSVNAKRMGSMEKKGALSAAAGALAALGSRKIDIAPFTVDRTACVGCGTCARLCPTRTVTIEDGAPRWDGERCTLCLACLQRCPTFAIDYGARTADRDRYVNPVFKRTPTRLSALAASVDMTVPDPDDVVRQGEYEEPDVDEPSDAALSAFALPAEADADEGKKKAAEPDRLEG
jgi:ferredoxin/flavodoxin